MLTEKKTVACRKYWVFRWRTLARDSAKPPNDNRGSRAKSGVAGPGTKLRDNEVAREDLGFRGGLTEAATNRTGLGASGIADCSLPRNERDSPIMLAL